jgi:hypothetical protein
MEKEDLEDICFNCNQFLPISMDEPTEFGICLNDEVFEPFIDELLENPKNASCQDLITCKNFSGEKKACDNFEEVETIEIDDNSSLGVELSRLRRTGDLNIESFKMALLEEQIKNIDWKTMPVDKSVAQLKSSNLKERNAAIPHLAALITYGNIDAFNGLFNFFKQLPPPKRTEEVHFKIELLRHLTRSDKKIILIPHLIDELYRTASNNTTRQWISKIFQFLEDVPQEDIQEPLEKILGDKQFSYKLKKKIKNILYQY